MLLVGRSVTLSGMGFGLCHTIADRNIHPSSCKANATRHGWPIRFLAGKPMPAISSLIDRDGAIKLAAPSSWIGHLLAQGLRSSVLDNSRVSPLR